MTQYRGIDYGMGLSNVDKSNGIHYGVISQNSINLDCTSDFENDYGTPHCPKCGNDVKASDDNSLVLDWDNTPIDEETTNDGSLEDQDWFDGKDFTCLDCKACYWSDSVYPDEALGWSYNSDGYKLCDCLDSDIFVLESPYYTRAQYCSPCVPGAGNLDNPCEDGPKTYCLGPDWFDSDSPMPYKCFKVSDDTEVLA